MLAVCFDECGDEVCVELPAGATREWVEETYPEYSFRYFQETAYTYEELY